MANDIENNDVQIQKAVDEKLKEQKKKKRKKRLIIIGVIVLIVIVVSAVSSGGGNSENTTESIGDASVSQNADNNDNTEQSSKGPQKVEAGTAVTIDDLKISYISCNPDYKDYSDYANPKDGNKVIRAEFKFENQKDRDVSLSGMNCYADDTKCDTFIFGVDDYSSPVLETISAGRNLSSVVYFEVPKNSENIEIEFETNFWTDEKTIFVVK